MSAAEEQEFQKWLADNSEDPLVSKALSELFDDCMEQDGQIGTPSTPHGKKRILWPAALSLAAAVLLAVVLPLSYFLGKDKGYSESASLIVAAEAQAEQVRSVQWLEKKVPVGVVDTLLLSDGTELYLNSGSRITYPTSFETGERRVFVDGEVYAKVSKDPARPFYVQSGDVTVKVLGTVFDLKAYGDADMVEARLIEGSVCLDVNSVKGDRQIVMKPGNVVQFDRTTGNVDIHDFRPELYKNFAQGRSLHFNNISMDDIAKDLERAFGTKVVVMDEQLAKTRFFAIFTNDESLDQILRAMNRNHRMTITRRDGVIYLSSPDRK